MTAMKVCRWGNSLAVRLPAAMVRDLKLKEGDSVELDQHGLLRAWRKLTREEALEGIRNSKWALPPDYKFDRDEANSREP